MAGLLYVMTPTLKGAKLSSVKFMADFCFINFEHLPDLPVIFVYDMHTVPLSIY